MVPPDADVSIVLDLDESTSLDVTAMVELLDQALKILGMTTSQIMQKRRWDFHYKLAPDCKDLAKKFQSFTNFLFGDNMKESAIENRKERAVSYRVTCGHWDYNNDNKSFLDCPRYRNSH